MAAGFGDRICILAASDDNVLTKSQLQQQQLLRGFAAQVAASHRFLRFLVFKSQENEDVMRWLTRGASGSSVRKQKAEEEQPYRLFAADFASRKSIEIPPQVYP